MTANPIDKALNLIAPNICINCSTEGNVLCQECQELLKPLGSICYTCGKSSRNFKPCPGCINKWSPERIWIYTEYSRLAKELIKSYKFGGLRQAAKEISGLMNETLPFFACEPVVTFVPTALNRKRARGFDHAELLAKEIARKRKWLVVPLLARQSKVRQLGSTRLERKQQLSNAFRPIKNSLIKNRYILLVDDVITTGSTIEACVKVLKKAGASQVDTVAFVRTPNKNDLKLTSN